MKCWYCGKLTMERDDKVWGGWFRCSECGATWTKLPKPARSPLGEEYDPLTKETKGKPVKTRRSKGVK